MRKKVLEFKPRKMRRSDAKDYVPRECANGDGEAQYAFQVLCRTVGKGQGQKTRKMKLSTTRLLCDRCARSVAYLTHLSEATDESLSMVLRAQRQQQSGPGLFEQVEV